MTSCHSLRRTLGEYLIFAGRGKRRGSRVNVKSPYVFTSVDESSETARITTAKPKPSLDAFTAMIVEFLDNCAIFSY